MISLIPSVLKGDGRIQHFVLSGSGAASTTVAAPGTGLTFIPIYAWQSGSSVGSLTYTNGTGGSNIFRVYSSPNGGSWPVEFYETPNNLKANQAAVLDSSCVGSYDFHVFCMVVRGGAGAGDRF